MKEDKQATTGLTDKDTDILREFFSGRMLAGLSIGHNQTMEALNELGAVLDPNSKDQSLGNFFTHLGKLLDTDSTVLNNFGKQMNELRDHDLSPSFEAAKFLAETFRKAELYANTDNPKTREEIHTALKKVPAAIDFILDQTTSLNNGFKRAKESFVSDVEHEKQKYGNRMPEEELQDIAFITDRMKDISKAFTNCLAPVLNFRAQNEQIKERANKLAAKFDPAAEITPSKGR